MVLALGVWKCVLTQPLSFPVSFEFSVPATFQFMSQDKACCSGLSWSTLSWGLLVLFWPAEAHLPSPQLYLFPSTGNLGCQC